MRSLIILGFVLLGCICDGQSYNNRYIEDYLATEFFNLHMIEDTIYVIGFAVPPANPITAKINISKLDVEGEVYSSTLYNLDSFSYNQFPIYQFSTEISENRLLIQGTGGASALNTNAFVGLYEITGNELWVNDIEPEVDGLSQIAYGSLLLENNYSYTWIDVNELNDYYGFLLHHDSEGNLLFEKKLIDENLEISVGSIILDTDSLIVAGIYVSNRDFKPIYEVRSGIMRMDLEGNFIDSIHLSPRSREPQQIIETVDKGYIVLDRKSVPVSQGQFPKYISIVTKLSNDLELEWEFEVGYPLFNTVLTNVKRLNDGNYIAVGINHKDEQGVVCNCGHLIKFTDSGQLLWDNQVESPILDDPNPAAFLESKLYELLNWMTEDLSLVEALLDRM